MFRVYHQYGNRWNGERFERAQCTYSAHSYIFSLRTQRMRSRELRQRFHDGSDRLIDNIDAATGYARGTHSRAVEARRARSGAAEARRTRSSALAGTAAGLITGHGIK